MKKTLVVGWNHAINNVTSSYVYSLRYGIGKEKKGNKNIKSIPRRLLTWATQDASH